MTPVEPDNESMTMVLESTYLEFHVIPCHSINLILEKPIFVKF